MKTTKPKNTQKKNSEKEPQAVMKPLSMVEAKYKFNIYQKRMELYILNEAQSALQGERHIAGRKIPADGMHPTIEIPLNLILQDENESNYAIVKRSAKAMTGKVIDYTDADGTYCVISPIISVKIPRYSPTMQVEVHRDMWNAILDYRKGWRKFDINTALSLKSVYSIKLYELISLHFDYKTYKVDDLKDFFGVKDKYKETKDFIRRVLDPVKKELDESSPWSFDYDIHRVSDKPQSKIIGFTIKPYPNGARAVEMDRKASARKLHLSDYVPNRQIRSYLLDSIGFTQEELLSEKTRRMLAIACEVLPDMIDILAQVRAKSRDKKNPKGWIINALHGKLDDFYKKMGLHNPLKQEEKTEEQLTSGTLPFDFDNIAEDMASKKKV